MRVSIMAWFGLIASLSFSVQAQLEKHQLIEQPATYKLEPKGMDRRPYLIDSYHLVYTQDDFSEKISRVDLFLSPKNFASQMAMKMICSPYEANIKIMYLENKPNLKEGGKLPNSIPRFSDLGFVYTDEQEVTIQVGDEEETFEIEVGGQTRFLSSAFKTNIVKQPEHLGMSFLFEFVFDDAPAFSSRRTSSEAAQFFEWLNLAIRQKQPVAFQLEADNGYVRTLNWDIARMLRFVPAEVIEFCITKRELR